MRGWMAAVAVLLAGCLGIGGPAGYTLEDWDPLECDPGQVDQVATAKWHPEFYDNETAVLRMLAEALGDPLDPAGPVVDNATLFAWETEHGVVGNDRGDRGGFYYTSEDPPFNSSVQGLREVIRALVEFMPKPDSYVYRLVPSKGMAEHHDARGAEWRYAWADQAYQGAPVTTSQVAADGYEGRGVTIDFQPPVDTTPVTEPVPPEEARETAKAFIGCLYGEAVQPRFSGAYSFSVPNETVPNNDWLNVFAVDGHSLTYSVKVDHGSDDCPSRFYNVNIDVVTGAVLDHHTWPMCPGTISFAGGEQQGS